MITDGLNFFFFSLSSRIVIQCCFEFDDKEKKKVTDDFYLLSLQIESNRIRIRNEIKENPHSHSMDVARFNDENLLERTNWCRITNEYD